jgi:tetratricopeptide (TPR) repeat protein
LTTFVNGNHQASFFGLSALCAFGLFFKAGTRLEKVLFMFALLVFVGVILVTGSVAGLVIFSLLILVFLVIRAFAHKGGGVFAFSNLSIVLAMLLTLFALILAFYPKEEGLLTPPPGSHSLETRFTIWEAALHLFKNFWLSGAGGGATGAVLTEANPIPNLIFYHLENQWLETLFEYGAIVGAVCILLVLFNIALIYPGFRGRTLHIAVFAGLCGLCLHNLVDFNLAFNGTGIPFASLLGALVGVAASKGNHKGRRFGVFLSISAQRILGMFAVGVVMFLAFRPLGQTTLEEHEPADPIDSQMRHPAWFLPAFSLAQSLQMQGDSTSSSKWVDFVQQRAPNFVSVKALVVRQLLMEGDFDKAKEAFSRLWLDKDFLSGQLEFIFATPQAQEAIPQFSSLFDAEDEEFWAIAKFLERKERFGIEEQVLRLAFEKNKYHPRVAFALGWLYLRFEMTREAEDVGFLSMAEYPEASQGYHILGLAKMQEKSYWDAYHLFLEGLKFAPYDYSLLSAAATSAISVRELDTAEEMARRALGVCETKAYCLNARILQSYVFEAKGDLKGALRVMEAGETLGMDNVPYLERMALLAIEAKNVPRAIYLLRRVLAIDPLNKRARDMLDKILK